MPRKKPRERLRAKKLSEKRLLSILATVPKRWREFDRRVYIRRLHLHNDDAVNPGGMADRANGYDYDGDLTGLGSMPETVSHVRYQTDMIRQVYEEAKDRLLENPWIVSVSPLVSGFSEKKAEDVAEVFNSGIRLVEERIGVRIQDAVADGQLIDGLSWLHWRKASELFPAVPDYEYIDELPEENEEVVYDAKGKVKYKYKRFEEIPEDDGPNAGKYRETEPSVRERTKNRRARAGFPFHIEILDCRSVFSVDDQAGEDAMVVHIRRIPVIDYDEDLKVDEIRLVQSDEGLRVYMEQEAPDPDDPSYMDWDPATMATIATIWTRDEWYELATTSTYVTGFSENVDWELIKSGPHAYGQPPFAKIPANRFNGSRDPALRFTPYLEGLFRRKPFHDRMMALTYGMAEKGLPWILLLNKDPNAPGLDETGRETTLVPDSAAADELPPGYDFKTVATELSQAHMAMLQIDREEMEAAKPPTGIADIGAATKPWTARTAIQQADKGPKRLIGLDADGILKMVRSMARVISMSREQGGFGDTVWCFKMGENRKRTREIVGIEPEDVESLDISVSINPISTAEQLTLEAHGMELMDAQLLTMYDFLKHYRRVEDPSEEEVKLIVEKFMNTEVYPGWFRQKISELFGEQYRIGVNGAVVNSQGSSVDPRELLAQQNIMAQGNANGLPGGQAGGPMGSTLTPRMPSLVDQPPPGVIPQPAVPG